MTAATLVLAPIFEADLPPEWYACQIDAVQRQTMNVPTGTSAAMVPGKSIEWRLSGARFVTIDTPLPSIRSSSVVQPRC